MTSAGRVMGRGVAVGRDVHACRGITPTPRALQGVIARQARRTCIDQQGAEHGDLTRQ